MKYKKKRVCESLSRRQIILSPRGSDSKDPWSHLCSLSLWAMKNVPSIVITLLQSIFCILAPLIADTEYICKVKNNCFFITTVCEHQTRSHNYAHDNITAHGNSQSLCLIADFVHVPSHYVYACEFDCMLLGEWDGSEHYKGRSAGSQVCTSSSSIKVYSDK